MLKSIVVVAGLLTVPCAHISEALPRNPAALLRSMTLGEKIGQMLQIRVYGNYPANRHSEFSSLFEEIRRHHIGSVELRVRVDGPNLVRPASTEVANTLNELQMASKLPLLVGADVERGVAVRLNDAPDMPNVMAWAAGGDLTAIRAAGKGAAEEARAVGIQWAFAPVVDVNDDPDNPIIGDRSFSDDPSQVSAMASEYIVGAHSNGLLTTAKHFPGHGNTNIDSHVGIVTLNQSLSRLHQVEFPPFESAIASGVDAVMLAHARVPALDPDPNKIATTSAKIIGGRLRRELGFTGIVVTDSMEMRGLTQLYQSDSTYSVRAAIDAVKAGVDILMVPEHVGEVYDALIHAVLTGEIPEARIDESVRRILALKEKAGLFETRFVDVSKAQEVFSRKSAWDFAQHVADDAVTLVRDKTFNLPLPRIGPITRSLLGAKPKKTLLVLLTDSYRSPLGKTFEDEFKRRQPEVQTRHVYYDNRSNWETGDLLEAVQGADNVVIAAFMTNLPGKKDIAGGKIVDVIGLNGASAELFRRTVDLAGSKGLVVSLGSPYLIVKYPAIQNYVCTFSISTTSERAAVKALFGEIQNKARLPVNLPGIADRGFAIPWPHTSVVR